MFDIIKTCQQCNLHTHQPPLLDQPKYNSVMVVGLSAKISLSSSMIPLDNETKSGHLIHLMEKELLQYNMELYRTNLVKCPPLDSKQKLRYPTQSEIDACFCNLLQEINALQPRIVLLLGKIVQKTFERNLNLQIGSVSNCAFPFQIKDNICYAASYHPSYVMRSNIRKTQYLENYSKFIGIFWENGRSNRHVSPND